MFLTIAIVAAVGAFAAAAFAVLPRHLYALAIVPVAVGMSSIVIVLGWLAQSTWATKPSKMLGFIGKSEPVWLCRFRRWFVKLYAVSVTVNAISRCWERMKESNRREFCREFLGMPDSDVHIVSMTAAETARVDGELGNHVADDASAQ